MSPHLPLHAPRPVPVRNGPLVVGAGPGVDDLADRLAGDLEVVPGPALDPGWSAATALEAWRAERLAGDPAPGVVVAVLAGPAGLAPMPLTAGADDPWSRPGGDVGSWAERLELPFARWYVGLTVGAARCADGGRVVAVVDRPDPLRGAGHAELAALATMVETTARSMAQLHAARGVGVHVVTTDERIDAHGAGGSAAVSEDLVGAVAMLLGARPRLAPPGGVERAGTLAAAVVRLGSGR